MNDQPSVTRCTTTLIVRNSFWSATDVVFGVVAAFFTSVAIARVIGPERLGHFNFIFWLTNVGALLGSAGMPITVRKYMGRYLGRGELGVARAIFFATLRVQMILACIIAAIGWVIVFTTVGVEYRWVSMLLVATMIPRMLVFIPSQANYAAENIAGNVPASIVATLLFTLSIMASLYFGWDLLGVAVSSLLYAMSELVLRLRQVLRWVRKLPEAELPLALRQRMTVFSRQGVALTLLQIVVWDRSDILFLRMLHPDIRQVTFFSVAFNITDKLLIIPRAFAGAVGATMMARAGRDASQIASLLSVATRYTLLAALPLLLGTAAISGPLTISMYGPEYVAVIPVLVIAAVFGIGKALMVPAQLMLQATEHQGVLVRWLGVCGCINVALDLLLIPKYGAVGAILANGAAQVLATAGLWFRIHRLMAVNMRPQALGKIGAAGLGMAATVAVLSRMMPPVLAICSGIGIGTVLYFLLVRLTRAVGRDDRERLQRLFQSAPPRLRPVLGTLANVLSPVR